MSSEQQVREALLEANPPPAIEAHWDDVLRRSRRSDRRRRRWVALVLVVATAVPALAVAGQRLAGSPRTQISGHGSNAALGLTADFSATRLPELRPVGAPGGRRFGGVRWQLRIDGKGAGAINATLLVHERAADLRLPLCSRCEARNHGALFRPALWLTIVDLPKVRPVEVELRTGGGRSLLRFPVRR